MSHINRKGISEEQGWRDYNRAKEAMDKAEVDLKIQELRDSLTAAQFDALVDLLVALKKNR